MKTLGKGSIVQLDKSKPRSKCRRWQLRVSVGYDPKLGRYRTKTRNVHGTYTEAVEGMRCFIAELSGMEGAYGVLHNATLAQYVDHYTRLRAEGKTGTRRVPSKSTCDKERWNLAAFCRAVGDMPLQSVTPDVIEGGLVSMRLNGASGTYLSSVYGSLRGMLAYALKAHDVPYNPMDGVERPIADTKPKRALTRHQIAALVDQLDPRDMYGCAIGLIATCGLRRGEVVALTWSCVHDGLLEVRKSKTDAGIRLIPLMPWAVDALTERREALAASLERFGMEVSDGMPIVANDAAEPITPHHLGVWWQKHRSGYGLEGWTLHELRHSFSSLLAASGASPKDIQELMGHSSPDTALRIYTHTNMEDKARSIGRAYDSLVSHR